MFMIDKLLWKYLSTAVSFLIYLLINLNFTKYFQYKINYNLKKIINEYNIIIII